MSAPKYRLRSLKVGDYIDIRRPPKYFVHYVSKMGREMERQFATRVLQTGYRRVMMVE